MQHIRKILGVLVTGFLVCSASSCTAWLKVDSPDRIMEEHLFESTEGFYTALNGVYIEMADRNLYGGSYSISLSDILAQYYDTRIDSHSKASLASFTAEAKRSALEPVWQKTYEVLLNINKIIAHCDHQTFLEERDLHLIKGEALGLRALLHFELFRLVGPVYVSDPEAPSLPYMDGDEPQVYPILKAKDAADRILQDLEASQSLLLAHDPVVENGKNEVDDGERNLYSHRNIRLNYFAVKALSARVNMYLGERMKAKEIADEVIEEASAFFPFSTREEVTGQASAGNVTHSAEDRILSSDVLFGVYDTRREIDLHDRFFAISLEPRQLLAMTENGYAQLYPEESDLRICQWQRTKDKTGNDIVALIKYEGMEVEGRAYPYLVPVIRMSEMYLISAECSMVAGSQYGALKKLNVLRNARQTSSVNGEVMEHIAAEYAREFVGEGQLFWFYKRNQVKDLPTLYHRNQPSIEMNDEKYCFELPQSEGGHR